MNIALMVITDGRWDYLEETIESADRNLCCDFSQHILVDDSGTDSGPTVNGFDIVKNPERRGLAGAIQSGWDALNNDVEWVFHLEDDFVFPATVNVAEMVDIITDEPDIAQVALLRQPWGPDEQACGGVFAANPHRFVQRDGYVEQEHLFTFNPCVYPRWIADGGAGLEQQVTDRLLGFRFAYLGNLDDDPRCIHIGHRRSDGYRW